MTHIHLIGIGGSGLSAIARLLKERGYTVSGSDQTPSPLIAELALAGIAVMIGHDPQHIHGADLVLRSSAIPDSNCEVQAAQQAGIPVLKRADFLNELLKDYQTLAVAGSHGKTTTTALLAWLLHSLGEHPSYLIGGISKNLGVNARADRGRHFVIEADEYDHMFLGLTPQVAIVLNVEHDHPDCYPTAADYRQAFVQFVQRLRPATTALTSSESVTPLPLLLSCYDDPISRGLSAEIPAGCRAMTFGLQAGAEYRAEDVRRNSWCVVAFRLTRLGQTLLEEVNLQIPGQHNASNACAALAALYELGFDKQLLQLAHSATEFKGAGRRFDLLGEAAGITIINDYAHHPTEIRATLAAARTRYPQSRIWAVWQPHTYSRTQTLLNDFCNAFNQADRVIITPIYAAREKSTGFTNSHILANFCTPEQAQAVSSLKEATQILIDSLSAGDVLIVLSAGDADSIGQEVFNHFHQREVPNA